MVQETSQQSRVTAFLALGSNLGHREAHLADSLHAIAAIPLTEITGKSSLYQSRAWGAPDPQPDYLNAVVSVSTALSPDDLHQFTAAIETKQGRQRNGEKNAARTLDIDVLLYAGIVMHTNALTIPHPRMHERAFVLLPLLEIAPDLVIPGNGSVRQLFDQLLATDIRLLGDTPLWT